MAANRLGRDDALLIVDFQKDFCPGGPLPVTECQGVAEALNRWIESARRGGSLVIASRDWHPPNHSSFASRGGPWPEHCVRETEGAEFVEQLQLPEQAVIISKGVDPETDQYSPFQASDLADWLKDQEIRRLWVGGVAQDVCIRATVLDALTAGLEVHVVVEATAPVDPAAGRQALEQMRAAGAILE